MHIVTRFAPSPTGFLHIGGARTALFNWLFAKHHKGTFLLRIEDTDQKRSTEEATRAILDSLTWLGLNWDDNVVYQSTRTERHVEIAQQLLKEGKAYYCYCTPEELEAKREAAKQEGITYHYDNIWRDRDPSEAPEGVSPSIRLKAPLEGETHIQDSVQGDITVQNSELDDMVLLRSDGTPTYMLAVVVDDHDMNVTHIIRGDDHLTNSFRQTLIYQALGWSIPEFTHLPLIHGEDGAKMSKRHGALGADSYRDMGYLPEALCNYLLRLGWSHGDDEIISKEQAVEWFNLESIGKSPARFDMKKLDSVNAHYIKEADNKRLIELIAPWVKKAIPDEIEEVDFSRLERGLDSLKERAKTLLELADSALFYAAQFPLSDKAKAFLENGGKEKLFQLLPEIESISAWDAETIKSVTHQFVEKEGISFKEIAQPLRAALTFSHVSPGVFEVMDILGKEETIARLRNIS